jgi:hypothetical protein
MSKILLNDYEFKVNGDSYSVNAELLISIDNNYGADADGNRGMPVIFLDDIMLTSVNVNGENCSDMDDLHYSVAYGYIEYNLEDILDETN